MILLLIFYLLFVIFLRFYQHNLFFNLFDLLLVLKLVLETQNNLIFELLVIVVGVDHLLKDLLLQRHQFGELVFALRVVGLLYQSLHQQLLDNLAKPIQS